MTAKQPSVCFEAALTYLSYKPRTEKEVRDYLTKKKFRAVKIDESIEKLKNYHYVDDQAYLKLYMESNAAGNRFGARRIKSDLSRRGLSGALLESIDSLLTPEDEAVFCQVHLEKLLRRTEDEPYRKRLSKISAALTRRGFSREAWQGLADRIPKDEEGVRPADFNKHFLHYTSLYTRKGYTGYEYRQRVFRAMLGRGYQADDIREAFDALEEE